MNRTEQNKSRVTHKLPVFICLITFFIATSFANPHKKQTSLTSAPRINIIGFLSKSPALANHADKTLYQKALEKYKKLWKLKPEYPLYQKIAEEFKASLENCKIPEGATYPEADTQDIWKAEIYLVMKSYELDEKFKKFAVDSINPSVSIGELSASYNKYTKELEQYKKDLTEVTDGLRTIEGSWHAIFDKNKQKRFPENMCAFAGDTVELFSGLKQVFENNEKVNLQIFGRLLSEKEKKQKEKWEAVIKDNMGEKAEKYAKPTFAVYKGDMKPQTVGLPLVDPAILSKLQAKVKKDFSRAEYKPLPKKLKPSSPNPLVALYLNTRLGLGKLSALFSIGTSKLENFLGIGGSDEHHKLWQEENWNTIRGNMQMAHNNFASLPLIEFLTKKVPFMKPFGKVPYTEDVYNSTLNNWQRMGGMPFWQGLSYYSDTTATALTLASPFIARIAMYYTTLGQAGEMLPVIQVTPVGNQIVPTTKNELPSVLDNTMKKELVEVVNEQIKVTGEIIKLKKATIHLNEMYKLNYLFPEKIIEPTAKQLERYNSILENIKSLPLDMNTQSDIMTYITALFQQNPDVDKNLWIGIFLKYAINKSTKMKY